MLACPFCVMELADIVAALAKAVREDILSKIPPRLFFVLPLPIVLSAKLIKVSELLLQSRVSFGGWPVRWFWRWRAWAARHRPEDTPPRYQNATRLLLRAIPPV